MVNYFIYATDDSMSTYGEEYFNRKGLETLEKFKEEVKALQSDAEGSNKDDSIVYLHWSHRCAKMEEDQVELRYREQDGEGKNTLPHTVLDWMDENLTENDTIQLLYVVTDGAVSPSNIRPIDPNMKIDNVTFYAFNSNIHDIDMSVASMFICNNKRYLVHCNEELVDDTDLSNPFDYDQITVETFHEKKEELKSYIKLQFLNKSSSDRLALEEIKKLKSLQTRLCNELQDDKDEPVTPAKIDLNVKDKETFINLFKNTKFNKTLTEPKKYDEKLRIASCINTLVNYINNDHKSFKFDNLKFNNKFIETGEEDVADVFYSNVEEIAFPDIILDNESGVPVILLTHYNLMDKILFKQGRKIPERFEKYSTSCPSEKARARVTRLVEAARLTKMSHFSRLRKTVDCPLILLNDPDFKDSIEYYYNLESFKGLIQHGVQTGPRTRRPFTGAIVPLEEFDDYNDYILSCTYFASRRVPYNKGLLYYVVYKTCEKLKYIEPNVVEYLKGYVIKRIAKTKCFLGLSKMSIDDPLIRVDLTTALWYCAELSSILFKNDPKHFRKEKIRMYSHYSEYMKEILEWFQYDVDTKSVDLRADIFRNVNRLKRIGRREDKIRHILEQIFKKEDRIIVSEMVNPDNIYKLKYLQLDHNKVIDESLLSAEVDINKFAHFMDYVETTFVPVCKQTMRPHFVTEDNKSYYEQVVTKSRRVVIQDGKLTWEPVEQLDFTRILSTNKLFISNIKQFSKYPTIGQFKCYVLKKKKYFRGKPVVFATNTMETIEKTHAAYKKTRTSINKFNKISNSSVNKAVRIEKENPFDLTEEEIPDFIKKAESYIVKKELSEAAPSDQQSADVPHTGLPQAQKPKKRKSKTKNTQKPNK
ncbi:unnamed protein product [Arctia plantaginis]|uniref:P94 n=1 Tax=Arctia plantaginis TaxID=874455 RepID=A0A8S1AIR9_ARCPL|nr:unnamed protein product [Arctia plantaginis]